MFKIDPGRLDLAREFRARPFGEHSPDLQAVLNVMRALPTEGKHVLLVERPGREWRLAVMRGQPPMPEPQNLTFTTLEEAEWHVFGLRWQALTGEPLELD